MAIFDDYKLPNISKLWLSGSAFEQSAQAMANDLELNGYAYGTICSYLSCVAHFSNWCSAEAVKIEEIDTDVISRFVFTHLPECSCAPRCRVSLVEVRAALNQWIRSSSKIGVLKVSAEPLPLHITEELRRFGDHLNETRGLQLVTIKTRQNHVAPFLLKHFGQHNAIEITELTPKHIHRYVSVSTHGWKPSSIKVLCGALRSYLRFKSVSGQPTSTLIASLPLIASWRQATLPKALDDCEVRTLLDAYDQETLGGQRDYAIARCYIDLGLRTAEILRLTLDDIVWSEAVLYIRGKGRRVDVLPLPSETGHAIAHYLQNRQIKDDNRSLFRRLYAPFEQPVSTDMIRGSIRNAAARCGLSHRVTGPHRLRHTLAIRLVRSGTSLKAIADILRHRELDTTTIYAKADLQGLSTVAGSWPGECS